MWTPLQPVGRCRLTGNDSGDENSDYVEASGSINSIIDCIDACIADGDDCVAIEYDGGGYCELWRSLPIMTENTGEDDENCLLKGDQLGMENAGQECWAACGSQQGECSDFCGKGGRCCRFGFSGNGCNANDGVDSLDLHLCVRNVRVWSITLGNSNQHSKHRYLFLKTRRSVIPIPLMILSREVRAPTTFDWIWVSLARFNVRQDTWVRVVP